MTKDRNTETVKRRMIKKIVEWLFSADEHAVRVVYAFVKRLLHR